MSSWHAKGGAAPTKNGPNTTLSLPLPPPAKPEKKPSTPPLSNQNVPAPPFYNYFAMFQVHLCWRGGGVPAMELHKYTRQSAAFY